MTRHRIAQISENRNPKSPENRPQTRRFLQIRLLQLRRSATPFNGLAVLHGRLRRLVVASSLLLALCATTTASAQKTGGVLKISFFDSPASMSLHEEATGAALRPAMGIFNNLVMYDQHVAQNRPDTIVADLATAWSWNEEGTALT